MKFNPRRQFGKLSIAARLLALILAVGLLCPPVTAAAQTAATDRVSWRIRGILPDGGRLCIAQYGAHGQLTGIRTVPLTAAGNAELDAAAQCNYRLLILDEDYTPLREAYDVPASDSHTYSAVINMCSDPIEQLYENFIVGMNDGTLKPFISPRNNYANSSTLDQLEYHEDGTISILTVKYNVNDFVKLTDHLSRTLKLAQEYSSTENPARKAEIGAVIPGLLAYWAKNDYQCSNWWYNVISTPNLLGEIALLARDAIPQNVIAAILPLMADGCFTENCSPKDYTGANAAWLAYSTLKYGILTHSDAAIQSAVNKLKSELDFSTGEGIRTDGTFMQHGARLYSGGYGIDLISNTADMLYLMDGTAYGLREDDFSALSTMILEGLQYLSIGNLAEPQSVGRKIALPGGTSLDGLPQYLRMLAALDEMPDKDELEAYALSIENNTRASLGLKYFDQARLIVIYNPDFYFCFRGCGKNLYYAENLNDENILSYNSSFGTTTTIVGRTADFEALQPVQDYSLIPGTTAVYETDEQLLAHTDYNKRKLSGTFGGKTVGDFAVSFAQSKHENISFTVACFATENSAILLGTGLSTTEKKAMVTTLQQEIARGDYTRSGDTVIHNGVKYTKLSGGELTAVIKTQTGNWRRNDATGNADAHAEDVFTLTMEDVGSYAYTVMGENTDETYEVLSNTTTVQAVKMPDGTVCAVFYGIGYFKYDGEYHLGKAGTVLTIEP